MIIANYKEHYEAFHVLLKKGQCKPILLFKGDSGTGKSTLMKHCRSQIDENTYHISVDLRNTTSVMKIFLQTGRYFEWDYFTNFRQHLSDINPQFNINVNGNTQAGLGNMINVELTNLFENTTPEQRAERYALLTNAWVEDLNNVEKPCIFMLDAYEQASDEIKRWIKSDFLSCVTDSQKLCVVIAGQNVPQSFDWDDRVEFKQLDGVHEAKEWLPVIKGMGRKEPTLEFLKGICCAFKGNPIEISKFIETLPLHHE